MQITHEKYLKLDLKEKVNIFDNFEETLENYNLTEPEDKQSLKTLISKVFKDETDTYIRRKSLESLCDLTILNVVRKGFTTDFLLEIQDTEDIYVLTVCIKFLFFFHEEEELEVVNKLIQFCNHHSGEVTSEAYFRLGQIYLFKANEIDYLDNLQKSNEFFEKANLEVENRLDAELFERITSILLRRNQEGDVFENIGEIIWKLTAFDFSSEVNILYFKLYECIQTLHFLVNSRPDEFFKNEFNTLCDNHYKLINSTLENQIEDKYLSLFKSNLLSNYFEPFYRNSLKAEKARVKRLSNTQENESQFWNYIIGLLEKEPDKKKEDFDLILGLSNIVGPQKIKNIDGKIDLSNPHEIISFIEENREKSNDKLITGSNVGDDIFKNLISKLKTRIPDYPKHRLLEFQLVLEDIIRYVKRCSEGEKSNPNFAFLFNEKALEKDLQQSIMNMLKFASIRADFYSEENKEFTDGGRVDIKYQNQSITIPIELKRTANIITEDLIREKYLSQAQTYTYNRDQLGIFVVLDLYKKDRDKPMNNLRDLFGITHLETQHRVNDNHPDYVVWCIVPGNKILPSQRSDYS